MPKALCEISANLEDSVKLRGMPLEELFERSLGSSTHGTAPANACSSLSGGPFETESPISG
jgi:hypothetical protein